MRVVIEKVIKEKCEEIVIIGITNIGKIKGNWKSTLEPVEGEEYNVELSLPMLKGNEVSVIRKKGLLSQTNIGIDDRIYFQGTCEFVDEDDIYVIRFATDWIEMLEINSIKVNTDDNILFSLPYKQIDLFPY